MEVEILIKNKDFDLHRSAILQTGHPRQLPA